MLTDEQKRFEKIHCGGNLHATRKNSTTGDYVLPSVQDAWSGWRSAIEAEVRAEDCRSQNSESERQDSLSRTDETQVRAEAQEPVACPHCDGTGDVHSPNGEWRGECNCGAEKYAMIDRFLRNNLSDDDYAEYSAALDVISAQQPTAPCPDEYERGKEDGWEACKTCHGIVDGKHTGRVALQAKVAELEALRAQDAKAYERLDELRNRDFETIAQQAERIAEIEKRDRQMAKRLKAYQQAWDAKDLHNQLSAIVFEEAHGVAFELAYSQQSALIEKCRQAIVLAAGAYNEHWESGMPIIEPIMDEALAAIAAQKGGAV